MEKNLCLSLSLSLSLSLARFPSISVARDLMGASVIA